MKRFEVYQALTDVEKFSQSIFWLVKHKCNTYEDLVRIMNEELSAETRQLIRTAVQEEGYPLSLERLH